MSIWRWASKDVGSEPDVVMACAGDVPTLDSRAAVDLLRRYFPYLHVRVVNVVDLMALQPDTEHPHGLSDRDFDTIFTRDRPIVFAHHGYPWLIDRLTYRLRTTTISTCAASRRKARRRPFDMCVLNDIDRFHLVIDVIERVPDVGPDAAS